MKIGSGIKTIVLHGGTHAREWVRFKSNLSKFFSRSKVFFINLFVITPITMINTARLLVENYRNGNTKYLDDITWHIVININPDGYEYTWTGSRFF